jgi:sec-independent protein translocase protein TatA
MGGIHIGQLLVIAVIVVVLFGTKKLRGIGSDLGESIKGFKKAMSDDPTTSASNVDPAGRDAEFPVKPLAGLRQSEPESSKSYKQK